MPMPIKINETKIPGVLLIETGCFSDQRGFFSETYSEPVWRAAGFTEHFLQDNLSLSLKGTLRGMHYQLEPYGMGKLVRVVKGAVFDAGVDLRRGSPAFGQWYGHVLSEENRLALWFPAGFAHGFVALEDQTLVYYKCNQVHTPEAERSLLYSDPEVAIDWPLTPSVISKKDAGAPPLDRAEYNREY